MMSFNQNIQLFSQKTHTPLITLSDLSNLEQSRTKRLYPSGKVSPSSMPGKTIQMSVSELGHLTYQGNDTHCQDTSYSAKSSPYQQESYEPSKAMWLNPGPGNNTCNDKKYYGDNPHKRAKCFSIIRITHGCKILSVMIYK